MWDSVCRVMNQNLLSLMNPEGAEILKVLSRQNSA